jgi:hypothetical protein
MSSFSFFHFIILIVIIALIYRAYRGVSPAGASVSNTGSMICPNCGTRGEPKTLTQGNMLIELILWLCFLIPGLIYSIWRLSSRKQVCPACEMPGMIGIHTPNGQLLLKKFTVQE